MNAVRTPVNGMYMHFRCSRHEVELEGNGIARKNFEYRCDICGNPARAFWDKREDLPTSALTDYTANY